MNDTLSKIRALVRLGKIRVSDHAYDEMIEDQLLGIEIVNGLDGALVVEDYPNYAKGPCVLVMQRDANSLPIHVLWGISAGQVEPAVIVTVYRPDPTRWDSTFLRRL